MAEAYTASYNPVTGERREFRQEVAPPPPPDYSMGSINPAAVEALYRTQKIEDAEKAVAAAVQFQGLRGYQQALEKGEPAEKALARYGPMMFYSKPQSFAPSVRALTPPQINPNQEAALNFRREMADRPKPMNISGAAVEYDPVKRTYTEKIPAKRTDPAESFQRRLDQDEYRSWFEQANGAKQQLSNPNVSPEAKARMESVLKRSESEMSKIRSKWQPSTGTNAPLSEQAKSFKPPTAKIPDSAIEYLRKNPNLRGAFDAKYGEGSAALFLQ